MPSRKNRKLWVKIEKWNESKNQTAGQSGAERDYMIVEIFCLLSRKGQKRDKKLEIQVFLVRLLVLLSFADLPRFCLVLETSALDLAIGFAIGGAEFIGGEVIVGFSGWPR